MPKKCDRNGAAKVRKVVKVHLGEETFHSAGVQARGRKCASVCMCGCVAQTIAE